MTATTLICSHCGQPSPIGTYYCPNCGEALDPALVRELQGLYTAIQDLDRRIAEGQGARTITELRDEYRTRYLALRSPTPAPAGAAAPGAPSAPVAAAGAVPGAPLAGLGVAAPSMGITPPGMGSAGVPPMPPAPPRPPGPPPPPPGPAFSWSAFIADQAIAILAYLGGFLLLIATLSFEVGGLPGLGDAAKLVVVTAAYLLFGALGVVFRGRDRLRTVGGAYLGVFALMTPLVALAYYLFALRGLGLSVAGMVCIGSAYATVVYLTLAWRTRFMTYAYLGWVGLLVTLEALVPWLRAPNEWWGVTLVAGAIVLHLPMRLRWPQEVTEPARITNFLASGVALFGVEYLVLTRYSLLDAFDFNRGAVALAAVGLVPLTLLWRWEQTRANAASGGAPNQGLDLMDGGAAALAAQAVVALATWAGIDHLGLAYLLGSLGLAEFAGAVALRRVTRARAALRNGLEGLGLLLATLGVGTVFFDAAPNVPLVVTLLLGAAIGLGIALLEALPWWTLAAGLYASFAYHAAVVGYLAAYVGPHPHVLAALLTFAMSEALFALALWAGALGLGLTTPTRGYAGPLYAVALGNALYVTGLVFITPNPYQGHMTLMLFLFAVAALVAGRREGSAPLGGLGAGFFGVLAVVPLGTTSSDALTLFALALVPAVAALAVRRFMGRGWAYAPYVVGLWATLLCEARFHSLATAQGTAISAWAIWLLIAQALLATVATLLEESAWVSVIPAGLGLWAALSAPDLHASIALAFALVLAGLALRQVKGLGWGTAWHVAALIASFAVIAWQGNQAQGVTGQIVLCLAFGAAAYLVAVQERAAWVTAFAAGYGLAATQVLTVPPTLTPTLVITFAAAGAGAVVRRFVGWQWALALYGLAVGASLYSVGRVPAPFGMHAEVVLLIFAVAAYLIAALEPNPWAGAAPTLYAVGAALVNGNAHDLLPLAVAFAVAGVVAGRFGKLRWLWPPYIAAACTAILTAVQGGGEPGFETLALAIFAVIAYAVAAIEALPDLLVPALFTGGLAVGSLAHWRGWLPWQTLVAFGALAWLYDALAYGWRILPWLATARNPWWAARIADPEARARWSDGRRVGMWLHRVAGLVVAGGAALVSLVLPGSFGIGTPETLTATGLLLALAALLLVRGRDAEPLLPGAASGRILWYVAGEFVALAITFGVRWLGADNIQAFVIAPGSYQLLIGALLPVDVQVQRPQGLGRAASVVGALLLLLPTLGQSFTADPTWLYAVALAAEAVLIVGVGLGTRARVLVLVGSSFVGLAALRGAILAFQSGAIALVIGALAALLMGFATWLSLRARREPRPDA